MVSTDLKKLVRIALKARLILNSNCKGANCSLNAKLHYSFEGERAELILWFCEGLRVLRETFY